MDDANKDDELLSFIQLAALTANVTRHLIKEDKNRGDQERHSDGQHAENSKENPDKRGEYVEHRLRQLAAWERRISGERWNKNRKV